MQMNAIDVHVHAFPDDLGPRAIAKLEAQCPWSSVARGTIGELIKSMDAAGIDASVVCTIATKPGQVKGILKWCQKIRCERIKPLPSVHPQDKDKPKWIGRFAKEGFVGIKLHPMYQEFTADETAADEIYAAAAEHGLIVAAHCGRDIAFPLDDRASPQRLARVLEKFDGLKLLCTHMGGWRMWDEVERHILGTGCYLETSFALEELGPQRAVAMMRMHGIERVMFGTDWPWKRQDDEVQRIKHLPITAAEANAILFSNAAKLLGY